MFCMFVCHVCFVCMFCMYVCFVCVCVQNVEDVVVEAHMDMDVFMWVMTRGGASRVEMR